MEKGVGVSVGRAFLATGVVVAVLIASNGAVASSASYELKASLDTNSAVPVVKDATGATATLTAKFTVAGKRSRLTWTLTFKNLSGRPTTATIYYGKSGKIGPAALPLCVKCQAPSAHGEYVGPYVALPTFVRAMLHNGAYVSVATRENPKGEVRGQIRASSA